MGQDYPTASTEPQAVGHLDQLDRGLEHLVDSASEMVGRLNQLASRLIPAWPEEAKTDITPLAAGDSSAVARISTKATALETHLKNAHNLLHRLEEL